MVEWYSSLVYVKGRDVLYEICGYMAKRVLDFIGYIASGFSRLDRILIRYTGPLSPFLSSTKKKAFTLCARAVKIFFSDGYVF